MTVTEKIPQPIPSKYAHLVPKPRSAAEIEAGRKLVQERMYYAQNRAQVDRLVSQGNPIPKPNMGKYNPATKPQGFIQEFKSPYVRPATQLKTLKWMGGGNLVLDVLGGRAGFNFDTALNLAAIGSMFCPGLGAIAGAGFAMKALGNFYDAFTGKGFLMNMFAGIMNTMFALPVFKLFKFGPSLTAACRAGGTLNKTGTGFAWGKFFEMGSRMCYGQKATNSLLGMISKVRGFGASPDKVGTALKAGEQARNGIWKFLDWFMGGRKAAGAVSNTALSPAGNTVAFSGVNQIGSILTATS